jgi:hypothetical protein
MALKGATGDKRLTVRRTASAGAPIEDAGAFLARVDDLIEQNAEVFRLLARRSFRTIEQDHYLRTLFPDPAETAKRNRRGASLKLSPGFFLSGRHRRTTAVSYPITVVTR